MGHASRLLLVFLLVALSCTSSRPEETPSARPLAQVVLQRFHFSEPTDDFIVAHLDRRGQLAPIATITGSDLDEYMREVPTTDGTLRGLVRESGGFTVVTHVVPSGAWQTSLVDSQGKVVASAPRATRLEIVGGSLYRNELGDLTETELSTGRELSFTEGVTGVASDGERLWVADRLAMISELRAGTKTRETQMKWLLSDLAYCRGWLLVYRRPDAKAAGELFVLDVETLTPRLVGGKWDHVRLATCD